MTTGLNIAALARRTGVAPDTLRKWEQRYGILKPTRTTGGQRRYSERDAARVLWLKARLDDGYRIGEAAALLGSVDDTPSTPHEQLRALLAAADAGDAGRLGLVLDQAFALNPVMTALTQVVEPLLRTVGDRWSAGLVTVAHEHLVTETVRARLAHLLSDAGGGVRGRAVLACAPGERHELGLMMTAIALRDDGWQVTYLGADTPLTDALVLASTLGARFLGLSVGTPERRDDLTSSAAAMLGPPVQLVLGGAAATPELAGRIAAYHVAGDLAGTVHSLRALAK